MRVWIRWLLRSLFRVRLVNDARDATLLVHGPRLVVAHCESALDGVLLGLFLPGNPLIVATPEMLGRLIPRILMRGVSYMTIDPSRPMVLKDVVHHVRGGGVAVIFPQGRVTTSGALMKSYDAAGLIVARCGGEVVPVRMAGTLYSRFAATSALWPKRLFPGVTITVGAPVRVIPLTPQRYARRERADALHRVLQGMQGTAPDSRCLFAAFAEAAALYGRRTRIIEDARRQPETYGQMLKVALALGRVASRETARGEVVGVLMPTISTTLSLILGLAANGRTAAMLNYSAGPNLMHKACVAAGVRTVIASRQFLAVMRLQGVAEALTGIRILYIEDMRGLLSLKDKLWLMGFALWFPRAACPDVDSRQPAVVLFTSGSEGLPKGVVLSHRAMLANMTQLRAVIDFGPEDKFFSGLPLYHTFGLIACALMPLMTGTRQFLYVSPLRYRTIPELVYLSGATYLFGTSTFLGHYARQAHPADFRSLRKVICGGEKRNREVADLWFDKFGLRILEGYGATECGPAMSLNTPLAYKDGSVGRFLPGIEYQIVPVPGIAAGGALFVRGPNLMSGYVHYERPGQLTLPQSSAGDGWHETGDIVEIDPQGFVTIAGRTRRFAKIAGEMVSLDTIEHVACLASPAYRHAALLIQVPGQGESTVLFTTDTTLNRAALLRAARELGVSDLSTARSIAVLKELPLLGNGKTDYVALGQRASETAARPAA